MSSVFPLTTIEKEDTPARLQQLASVPLKNKWLASDQNQIREGLIEVHGRSFYLEDVYGKRWFVRKGYGNTDTGAFEEGDKIEAWVDEDDKTEWVEGMVMGNGFRGVVDLNNTSRFFETNRRQRFN